MQIKKGISLAIPSLFEFVITSCTVYTHKVRDVSISAVPGSYLSN